MKRLMITSAIGLCLAAPAFAQTTTDQERLNRERATPPSNAAPAAQNQNQQRQPANRSQQQSNQGGQAQNQQQPSSSAQAPAASAGNQNQTGQAQNQQPAPSRAQAPAAERSQRSATDQNRPAAGRAQNRQAQPDRAQSSQQQTRDADRSAALNVNLNETQRTRIASAISSTNVQPVTANFRLATGVVVPRSVALHTLPASIVEIVPQYRGYRYFVTRDQIVIVEPRKKTVVAMLPAGGAARAQAPAAGKVSFTDQQREIIRKRASTLRSTATTGSSSRIVVEQEVPATVELEEFPAEIVTEVPAVRGFRYFRQDNDVVVVDPGQRRVIEVIR
jgi:hypothetical protein